MAVTSCNSNDSTAGEMYGLIKLQKFGNLVRMIKSGCNAAMEKFYIFSEIELFNLANNLPFCLIELNWWIEVMNWTNQTYHLNVY